MPGERCGFRGNAFHQVAIAHDAVGEMIDDLEPIAVVPRRQVRLGHRQSDPVGEALAKRARRDLDTASRTRHALAVLGARLDMDMVFGFAYLGQPVSVAVHPCSLGSRGKGRPEQA